MEFITWFADLMGQVTTTGSIQYVDILILKKSFHLEKKI
jgi:hypothetical protein